jgi:predicted regulator of Ras-like GTPase activity (Roadblock/LC7/MglB family)
MWSANFLIGGAGIYVFRRIGSGRLAPVSPRLTNLLHQISWRGYRGKSRRHVEDLPLSTPPRRQETVAAKSVLPATVTANSQPLVVESPVPKPRPVAPPVPVSLPQLELTPVPEILRHFTNRTRADLVFLIDCRGVPLAYCKNPTATLPPGADLAMLAKLAASQIATTQALGRSLGEDDHFFSSFQEGERRNVLNLQINRDFILLALFDKTAMLGAIRLHAHEARTNLQKILE